MLLKSHQIFQSKVYPDSSLILSKRIPSWYVNRWPSDAKLTILPSFLLSWAVFFIVSNRRFVKRKWPAKWTKTSALHIPLTWRVSSNCINRKSLIYVMGSAWWAAFQIPRQSLSLIPQKNKRKKESVTMFPCFDTVKTIPDKRLLQPQCRSKELERNIPKWLVANCSSILSWESVNGDAITPALLLSNKQYRISVLVGKFPILKLKLKRDFVCVCFT